jgi:hypothetical protein
MFTEQTWGGERTWIGPRLSRQAEEVLIFAVDRLSVCQKDRKKRDCTHLLRVCQRPRSALLSIPGGNDLPTSLCSLGSLNGPCSLSLGTAGASLVAYCTPSSESFTDR